MNDCKEIRHYIKNNELDLERIINEYLAYTATIISNMAQDRLNNEDKEEIDFEQMSLQEHYMFYEKLGLEKKEIIKQIAKDRNVPKNEIYQQFLNS